MIQQSNTRYKDGEVFSPIVFPVTTEAAYRNLVKHELGFGAHVIGLSETEVKTRVSFLGCVDDTVFSGPKEEMALLVEAVAIHLTVRGESQVLDKLIKATCTVLASATPGNQGVPEEEQRISPLIASLAGGMVLGEMVMKTGLCAVYGLQALVGKTLDDIIDALLLVKSGEPKEDVLALY